MGDAVELVGGDARCDGFARLLERAGRELESFDSVTVPAIRVTRLEDRGWIRGPVGDLAMWSTILRPVGEDRFLVAEFEPGRLFALHAVEGPMLLDGRWELAADDGGTRLHFVGEGPVKGPMKLFEGPISRSLDKRFRGYHATLKQLVEAA